MRELILIILSLINCCAFAQQTNIKRNRVHLSCKHHGIKRCINYDVYCNDVPTSFEGYKIAFVTDTHLGSSFKIKHLPSINNILNEIHANLVILGGDYQEGCEYVKPLFESIAQYKATNGTYGVLGNNDYERCTDCIRTTMKQNNIKLLENDLDTIWHNNEFIILVGAKNTYKQHETIPSPTLSQNPSNFVILTTHTPDYVEDIDIKNTDIALAGHTHGGQITLFGLYAPVTNSHYHQKFLKKIRYNSSKIPIIISNGIGTSRKNLRFFAPSEIIILTLHKI